MRRSAVLASASCFCAGLLLCGCIATQRDILDVEQQTDELKLQVAELKKTLNSVQGNQADLAVKVDQVHSDVSTFTETMKDSQDRMEKLSAKMDDLQVALGQKVSALGDTISKQQAASQAEVAAAQAAAKKAQDEEAAVLTPSQLYRSAKTHLRKKNYALAAAGFQTYLRRYPKGANADWATFDLGESYFGQKSWEDAAKQFALVLDRWPKSKATAAARLKYAVCLIKLNKNIPEAKRYLESVPEDFPKSVEAAQAAKLLKNLPSATLPTSK